MFNRKFGDRTCSFVLRYVDNVCRVKEVLSVIVNELQANLHARLVRQVALLLPFIYDLFNLFVSLDS